MATVILTSKEKQILAEIRRRGLRLEEYPHCVRVRGRGVDLTASKLHYIDLDNLAPYCGQSPDRPK